MGSSAGHGIGSRLPLAEPKKRWKCSFGSKKMDGLRASLSPMCLKIIAMISRMSSNLVKAQH